MVGLEHLVACDTHRIGNGTFGRQGARLIGVIVARAHGIEHRVTDACIERELRGHFPFLAQVDSAFQSLVLLEFIVCHNRQIAQRFVSARTDVIHHRRCTEVQLVLFQGQVEVGLGKILVDIERKTGCLNGICRLIVLIVIMVVSGREVRHKLFAEDGTPMCRDIHIAIAILLVVVEGKAVTTIIAIDVQFVILVEGMREGSADVIESGLTVLVSALFRQHAHNPVAIGGTSAEQQRGAFLPQRDFEVQLAGKQTDACHTHELLLVGLLAGDIQDRRDTSPVLARDTALVDFHIAHHVAVEGCKESEQVSRVIDGTSIEEHEVLVGRTTTHIEPAGCLAHGLHTRKGLHHLQHVHFAHGSRNVLQK